MLLFSVSLLPISSHNLSLVTLPLLDTLQDFAAGSSPKRLTSSCPLRFCIVHHYAFTNCL